MWEMRAFENSLRGGPEVSPRPRATPNKSELIRNHHKSCTGAFHGCGVGKNKREAPPVHACCHANSNRRDAALGQACCHGNNKPRDNNTCCHGNARLLPHREAVGKHRRPTSLELSDTDSGQESLASPLRNSKTESLDEDNGSQDVKGADDLTLNGDVILHADDVTLVKGAGCCRCQCHCVTGEANLPAGQAVICEEDMLKRLQALTEPAQDDEGGKHHKGSVAMESAESIAHRLSQRRRKRNQRVAEHVAGGGGDDKRQGGEGKRRDVKVKQKKTPGKSSPGDQIDGVAKQLGTGDAKDGLLLGEVLKVTTNGYQSCNGKGENAGGPKDRGMKVVLEDCKTGVPTALNDVTVRSNGYQSCNGGSTLSISDKESVTSTKSAACTAKSPSKKASKPTLSKRPGPAKTQPSALIEEAVNNTRSTPVRGPLVRKLSKPESKSSEPKATDNNGARRGVVPPGRVSISRRPPVTAPAPAAAPRRFGVPGVAPVAWREVEELAANRKPGNTDNATYKDLHEMLCDSLLEELKAKSDDQLANERAWLDAERLWLVHRAGFTACRGLQPDAGHGPLVNGDGDHGGRVTVRLETSGDVLTVDDDDVEKANPPQFDRVEDLGHLRYLNESSALHTLRQRYASNLVHTYAGSALLVINPMAPLAIYSDKVVSMFRGCKAEDMPPHIYSLAQSAYRGMLASRRDQAIVLLGRSGSGKTANLRHALHYVMMAAGSANKLVTADKLNAVGTVLEAFGNARTRLNANATRFTQIFSLDFDQSGQISSASVQVLLLERSRVARRPEGESSFHALYQLVAGVEGQLRKQLYLEHTPAEPNLFLTPLSKHEDKQKAALEFARVGAALKTLGVTDLEAKVVWSVLAAIFHLGFAGAVRAGTGSRWQFASPQSAQHAAHLLGTTLEELARAIFGHGATPSTPRAPFRTPSPTEARGAADVTGTEALEGMVMGLYGEAFNAIAALINRSISAPIHTVSSLVVVDAPGFQNPASVGQQGGASFEDLCHNYLQERLQLLFHYSALTAPRDRYQQEGVECPPQGEEGESPGPAPMVSLLDRAAPHAMLRSSQTDLREGDRRGLLWLLDEQAVFPCASEEAFLERLFQHYSDRDHQVLLRKAPGHNQFILQHLQGTNPVLYSATGWLKASRENPVARTVITLLQESNKEEVSQLFVSCRGSGVSGGSIVGIEGTQSLRRASSIRRTFTSGTAGIKRKSLCLQVKFTVDGLVETLRRTRLKFVHCLLPQHTAGLSSLRTSLLNAGNADDELLNIPLLRSQLRGSQLISAVRLHKQGFPKLLPLPEFRRRFRLLSPLETRPTSPVPDERRCVEDMLIGMDLDITSYRVGLSQIFFRSGVLSQLEAQRDERLSAHVVRLQSRCRGYLARRALARLRLQDAAVRCVQRNVRLLLGVRDWPWWKLLMRVTPLLNVHRTEEQLRQTTDELETLRSKVDKLDTERGQLQHDNDKLGAKLSEMTADLAEEHSTSILATERLEAETSERLRLERELQEIQVHHQSLSATSERLEMELLYLRAADGGQSEDEEGGGGVYKQRYERTLRELELTKHRLQQQHEDDLEQLVALKKQMEKKLADAYEEVNEQRQVVGQWKRKVQKLTAETNDLRLLLEEQNSRNTLLEKKQRRFDSEFQLLQEQFRQEKQNRERASREREMALGEKYTLEQNLSALRLELDLKEEHANSLSRELDELTTGGHTDVEVASLKRAKNEMEKKLQEQEEELDDLAGQLALLGQAKLRLEMSLEQQRKEARREATQRDEELEDVRCNATKKVKALESQLESEHEERTLLLREKHELERRLSAAQDQAGRSQQEQEQVARLKRDLKRTKALLKDAQLMAQKSATDAPAKALLRQLRNQLEDAELARAAAVKGRQGAECELSELQGQLEETQRGRQEAEEKAGAAGRERQDLRTQLDENEEELAEVLKKYRGCVQQLSGEQLAQQEQAAQVVQLECERAALKEQLAELTTRLECAETLGDPGTSLAQRRLELKTREMESRLELEQTTRARLEVQISRLKDAVEKLQAEGCAARAKEQSALCESRKLARTLREVREEAVCGAAKEAEAAQRRRDAEGRLEAAQAEAAAAKADLRLALTRINDLQTAIQDDCSQTDSDRDSDSDESIESFLVNHDTTATWDYSRISLSRSPQRHSPSTDLESSKSADLPKTIADSTTKESYA